MSDVVFILGAGASQEAGAPLMKDFLDVAYNLWKLGKVSKADNSFKIVFDARNALQSVFSKSQLDIQNVESVFAAFEMAKTLNKFADYTTDRIDELSSAMKSVIVHTLEQTLLIPVEEGTIHVPLPYQAFIDLVKYLTAEARPQQSVSVITFNYDLALDFAFHINRMDMKYLYGLLEDINATGIPLLKLHGSLNWAQCNECNQVVPWELSSYFTKHEPRIRFDTKTAPLNLGSRIGEFKHCNCPVMPDPVVAPPTWSKTEYHRLLSPVWSRAAKELSEAESIFVIGYSLPLSDAFFRYLYALGTVGEKPLSRFWVYDTDNSGSVERRYKELIGSGAAQRFQYFTQPFSTAIPWVKSIYI